MLPVMKIYVDSKYRVSGTDSNFTFQLPQTCYMPDDTKFFIGDVCVPHSWYSINDFNSKLYLRAINITTGLQFDYILTLTKKTYNGATFATELANKIQTETGVVPTKSFDATTNILSLFIGPDLEFQFLTDKELQDPATLTADMEWNATLTALGMEQHTISIIYNQQTVL